MRVLAQSSLRPMPADYTLNEDCPKSGRLRTSALPKKISSRESPDRSLRLRIISDPTVMRAIAQQGMGLVPPALVAVTNRRFRRNTKRATRKIRAAARSPGTTFTGDARIHAALTAAPLLQTSSLAGRHKYSSCRRRGGKRNADGPGRSPPRSAAPILCQTP